MAQAILALADGSIFRGRSIGVDGERCGELVFNTAMTGYQEILTDPSYLGQIITFTCPHIGNTGVNKLDIESDAVQVAGLVVRDAPAFHSSWRADGSLHGYLNEHDIVAISEVDTRELTRRLRSHGAQNACLIAGARLDQQAAIDAARAHPAMTGRALVKEVSIDRPQPYSQESVWQPDRNRYARGGGKYHVVAYDCGIKRNILRLLAALDCRITLVPTNMPAQDVLALKPDGVFLSNGPGDPEPLTEQIEKIKVFIDKNLPLFGICLGHQLLGLAVGGKTVKMKFGHHGANHPVQDLVTGQVMITSQNHGFAVAAEGLPENVYLTHKSLYDGSVQGIAFKDRPVFGFQGHPEASPGPHDAQMLFGRFLNAMSKAT